MRVDNFWLMQDAAKHRVKLIADMKQSVMANNYGVITYAFAASSSEVRNTTYRIFQGKRQQHLAHTCTTQPILQVIARAEKKMSPAGSPI